MFGFGKRSCALCDKSIEKGTTYHEAGKNYYHQECFKCARCSKGLADEKFILKGKSCYCQDCYVNDVALKCIKCSKPVISMAVKTGEDVIHRECFVCVECRKPLEGQYFEKHGAQYCGQCSLEKLTKKCAKCTSPIIGDSKIIEAENEFFHHKCFKCASCSTDLSKVDYYERGQKFYCQKCIKKT